MNVVELFSFIPYIVNFEILYETWLCILRRGASPPSPNSTMEDALDEATGETVR